ncbi:MAG: hypothetical protein KatS3mg029_0908 [Saprospiraceae bacterium]|nr:MAG: hypothetical protein KatS3mg029_0908 [Saprospiraceae bacterium]
MKSTTIVLLFSLLTSVAHTQAHGGYRIEAQIDGWEGEQVYLGYRRGDKVYSRDTTRFDNGKVVFEGDEPLHPGIYLILLPPDNKFFEFVVTRNEQHISMKTAAPAFMDNLVFKNSPENELLQTYQRYMAQKMKQSQELQEKLKNEENKKKKEKIQKEIEAIGKEVREYQQTLIRKHPNTFAAKLVAAFMEPEFPPTPPDVAEPLFRWQYYKRHYWDGFDFSEEVFVNSPYLKEKVDYFIGDKMTVQMPDSVIAAVDTILKKAEGNEEMYKWLLPYFLNKYYTPEIMGLDAVFVHLAEKYYATGKAPWITEEAKKKILDDAYMNHFVLIGNAAPDVTVQQYDPETKSFPPDKLIRLYDVDADFIVVYLWKPGCGHCKKVTDELKPFYAEWKDKGVEIFSISSATHADLDKAISDIEHKKMPWIVTADPYQKARALVKFYGTSLPRMYLLNKDKKIIASRFGVQQLPQIIEDYQRRTKVESR